MGEAPFAWSIHLITKKEQSPFSYANAKFASAAGSRTVNRAYSFLASVFQINTSFKFLNC